MKKAPAAGPVETGAARMRKAIRTGRFDRVTFGRALGFVQANLVILPADWAGDFLRYCHANPEACPLLCVSEPGQSPAFAGAGQRHRRAARRAAIPGV